MVASKVAPAKGSVKDSIDRVLDSYDKNDDGRFDKNEVRAIALELVGERRAASSLRKIVMVLAVALLVAIGVNFASIIIGVELTKESTVDGTTGVLSPSGHKDTAAITGSLAVGVSVQDARRRRLKESHGRALVSVADVGPACAPTIQAATIASTFTGSIRLANAAGFTIHPGHVVAEEQDASGSTMYTVQGNNEDEPPYVVLPVSGSTSCEVSMEVNARRGLALEAPTAEKATEWRRRLTQRAPEAGWSGGMPGCIVFDCFEGDEGCSEPSPHEACLLWSTDGDRCIEPACRLAEQAGRRRRMMAFISGDECFNDWEDGGIFTEAACCPDSYSNYGRCRRAEKRDDCEWKVPEEPIAELSLGAGDGENGYCRKQDCFADSSTGCRILDPFTEPTAAFRQCFGEEDKAAVVAERVPMKALKAGDLVLSSPTTATRVIVNLHDAATADKTAAMLTLEFSADTAAHNGGLAHGALTLTPDHVLKIDGAFQAASTAKVGSVLDSGSHGRPAVVTRISEGVSGIVNPLTMSGRILAAGPAGAPVVASVFPAWIAPLWLDGYQLPYSLVALASFLFPQSVQAFYNAHIEENFPTNSLVATRVAVPASVTYLVLAALDISIVIAFGLWALGLKGLAALGAIAVARRTIKVC